MTTDELVSKHYDIPEQAYKRGFQHAEISIQFAIDVLVEVISNYKGSLIDLKYGLDKINELKSKL